MFDLLPALPDALSTGSVMGVCARGGFELAFNWTAGILGEVEVLSKAGGTCKLHSGSKKVSFDTEAGKRYKLSGDLELRSVGT